MVMVASAVTELVRCWILKCLMTRIVTRISIICSSQLLNNIEYIQCAVPSKHLNSFHKITLHRLRKLQCLTSFFHLELFMWKIPGRQTQALSCRCNLRKSYSLQQQQENWKQSKGKVSIFKKVSRILFRSYLTFSN